ncbi:MAG: DUF3293 domain-containing protein [Gammaproteobacteria bacterium]|nr:DUF3293 domain-containing protein [Gammaproteobacteria bacterium]
MNSVADTGDVPPPPSLALVESYRTARYRVMPAGRAAFELRIGEPSPACDAWLAALGASTATVVTAWNPLSVPCDDAGNRLAQDRLEARLRALGRTFAPATNTDPHGHWPAELSIVALDLAPGELAGLLREFAQYAAVVLPRGAAARLAWHPDLDRER